MVLFFMDLTPDDIAYQKLDHHDTEEEIEESMSTKAHNDSAALHGRDDGGDAAAQVQVAIARTS